MPLNISMSDFINGNFPVGIYYGFEKRHDGRIDLITEQPEGGGGGETERPGGNSGDLPEPPSTAGMFVLTCDSEGNLAWSDING